MVGQEQRRENGNHVYSEEFSTVTCYVHGSRTGEQINQTHTAAHPLPASRAALNPASQDRRSNRVAFTLTSMNINLTMGMRYLMKRFAFCVCVCVF